MTDIIEIAPDVNDTPEDIQKMIDSINEMNRLSKSDDDFLIIPEKNSSSAS